MEPSGLKFLPEPASTVAGEVDTLIYFLVYLSLFFMALIYGGTLYFAIKYRRRGERVQLTSGPSDNHKLELTWTIIPTILVLIIFVWGFKSYLSMTVVPANALEIKVTAQKWNWIFEYPNGATTFDELTVPAQKPIKLLMFSKDVLHSFFIPVFRIKMDVLPNRYTIAWFEALRVGEFDIYCTEYCGQGHSAMLAKVKTLSAADFDVWLNSQGSGRDRDPVELGQELYTTRACNTCHTLDGTKSVGPTFKGIFGRAETLVGGASQNVDENYIRESILLPQIKIVEGFQPVMPTFEGILQDYEIDALIAYLKTLE